ncbi:MAG TPA: SIMPL domain-containing protein [Desulfotomaculum sp.]|nr:MAG: Uncharacterized protein XD78_2130 [Desulfotomaculum sp. 46_296]HAG12225.1 SIMPL domain-containing protein [Desulfotomaculum sp.]HBY05268.1 SIMPL domain-containing protein [Desulfotomaculum sp.]
MSENGTGKFPIQVIAVVILGICLIICTMIFTSAFARVRSSSIITVTGSAEKQLKSDLIVWDCSFTRNSAQLTEAYAALHSDLEQVNSYLKSKGIPDSDITIMPVNVNTFYAVDKFGRDTGEIRGYSLTQTIEVRSKQVDSITNVSRESSELINKGINLQSMPPQYFYTKLSDIKVDMLADATLNAKKRAEKIVINGGSKIGPLRSTQMGVFQITPIYSTEVSDYGMNDTSSLEKKITAVVNVEFYIK